MESKARLASPLPKAPPANTENKSSSTKKTLHEQVTGVLDVSEQHEKEMSDMMKQIIHSSKSNYRFKANTNGILVVVGTILIISPIAFTWLTSTGIIPDIIPGMIPGTSGDTDLTDADLTNLTNLNYFLGGIGLVAFVTTFFNKPQRQMTVAIADLAQLFLICHMFRLQYHTTVGKLSEETDNEEGTCNKELVVDTSKKVYDITRDAAELIDRYIERHARSDESARKRTNQSNDMLTTT